MEVLEIYVSMKGMS